MKTSCDTIPLIKTKKMILTKMMSNGSKFDENLGSK